MLRKALIAASLLAVAMVVAPQAASAAVTIGSVIDGSPISDAPSNCLVATLNVTRTCTLFNTEIGTGLAPGGLTAPSAGVITRWRVQIGTVGSFSSMTVTPRVLRPQSIGILGVSSGTPRQIPAGGGTFTFDERLPIEKGDAFGIDVSTAGGNVGAGPYIVVSTADPSNYTAATPAIANGATYSALISIGPTPHVKIPVNADIEPDVDGDGYGDETQDGCPQRTDVHSACPAPAVTTPTFTPGKGFQLSSDTGGKLTSEIDKVTSGRKKGARCSATAKKGKRCTIYTKLALWNDDVPPGAFTDSYAYKVGGKELRPGKYRATLTLVSAQNTTTVKTLNFTVKAKKRKKK